MGDRKGIIFDTKAQELERKNLFLQMINDEVLEADYSIADIPSDEPIIEEEIEEGFIDNFEDEDYNGEHENE